MDPRSSTTISIFCHNNIIQGIQMDPTCWILHCWTNMLGLQDINSPCRSVHLVIFDAGQQLDQVSDHCSFLANITRNFQRKVRHYHKSILFFVPNNSVSAHKSLRPCIWLWSGLNCNLAFCIVDHFNNLRHTGCHTIRLKIYWIYWSKCDSCSC